MSDNAVLAAAAGDQSLLPSARTRSRLAAILIAVLVVLLLVVTPPLIKMNRYARRIALSMSQSLGRPVHLDSVSLGLLPVPHLTLQNVVVSEDPAFGNEPIIRANVVEANLRLSSLWRSMEFSRVRFVEPSVNLVRNAEGRWNLEGVLVHAAQVDTAPTAQQHRSGAPRFPYIEATGGRVNIKIGDEKKPLSLTDADFALWLPSPEQWSVRLTGTPARTDVNLSDAGILRVEGSFQRAPRMAQVPVSLQASWHNAPLGEATRLLTGEDQGWRGTAQIDASIHGVLGAGRLETDFAVDDLRRADFVPVHTLSLHLHCAALAEVPSATLQNAACSLPAGSAQPLRIQAESLDLANPSGAAASVQADGVPLEWFASWVRLFSARFPASPALPGSLEANLSREDTRLASLASATAAGTGGGLPASRPGGWAGTLTVHLPMPRDVPGNVPTSSATTQAAPLGGGSALGSGASSGSDTDSPTDSVAGLGQSVAAEVSPGSNGDPWRLTLLPTSLRLSSNSALNLSGTATPAGYAWRAAGVANPEVLLGFARKLPPLADGLAAALGRGPGKTTAETPASVSTPVRLDVSCSRAWSAAVAGDQTCSRTAAEAPRKPLGRRR